MAKELKTFKVKCLACGHEGKEIRLQSEKRLNKVQVHCNNCHSLLRYTVKEGNFYFFKPLISHMRSSGFATTYTPY